MSETVRIQFRPAGLPVPVQGINVSRGKTIEQMVLECYGSLDGIAAYMPGKNVQWEEVPRHNWHLVRPKWDDVLRFEFRPHGGGGNNLFATIAAIALAVIAPGIGQLIAGGLASAGLFAAGSAAFGITASLAGAAVAVGGSLLLAKLFPAETARLSLANDADSRSFEQVTSDANPLAKEAYLPLIVGSRRVSLPDVAQPRPYLEDGIQCVDRVQAAWGAHSFTDVRADGTPVDSIPQITTQIRDGKEATSTYTFVDEISAGTAISEQLSTFQLDGTTLEDRGNPSNSEPRFHYFSTAYHPNLEEIAIRLKFDGLTTSNSATQKTRVPIRISFRAKGASTWNNLPEIHLIGRDPVSFVRDIRLRWDSNFDQQDIDGELEYEFWKEVPQAANQLSDGTGGGASPTIPQWEAHSYFSDGSGYQDVKSIFAKRFGVKVELNEATFPKAEYEWRIERGAAVNDTALNSSYQISGTVHSLFLSYFSSPDYVVPVAQGGFLVQVSALQATAIADEHPVQKPETAVLALKSKGQNVRNITVKAARYVYDWNGSSWSTETASCTNPATHYRQILYDFLRWFGVDTDLIDNDTFVAWRQECIDQGYEVSGLFAGEPILEVLAAIATAGYARPVYSHQFTVDYFRDRSAETPVQTFSHRNTSAINFSIILPERPAGYRAKFQNRDDEWRDDEIFVSIDNAADIPSYEAVEYRGIDSAQGVRKRAFFDLLQTDERRRQWSIETSLEGVLAEVGDMVSVVTDLFDDESHGVRIRQVIDSTHIVIDQEIPGEGVPEDFSASPDFDIDDILQVGEASIIFVHTPTGTVQRTITGVSGRTIQLDTALPQNGSEALQTTYRGQHCNITTLSNAQHRCIVTGIQRKGDVQAVVTAVDEAPGIFTRLQERFG